MHVAYSCFPLGALTVAADILWPGSIGATAALHPWMAGAIGLMTLAVMTRATLGHTGQALTAGAGTVAIYGMIGISVLARLGAGLMPVWAMPLYTVSGLAWIAGFAGFAGLYGRLLLRRRATA